MCVQGDSYRDLVSDHLAQMKANQASIFVLFFKGDKNEVKFHLLLLDVILI